MSISFEDCGVGSYDNMSLEEIEYNEEMNNALREQFLKSLAAKNIHVFKWEKYRFMNLSGHRVLCCKYYRYGQGSPVPVLVSYYNCPIGNGTKIAICISYQSNHEKRFKRIFDEVIGSIHLNLAG